MSSSNSSSTQSSSANSGASNAATTDSGSDNSFEARSTPDGVYDQLANDFVLRPHDWLASGEILINTHYRLHGRPAPRPGGWPRSTANRLTREEEELRVSLFGELVGKDWGTRISSKGNFVHGVSDDGIAKTITDGTSVRNKLMIRCPSKPTDIVDAAWDNQKSEFRAFESDVVDKHGSCGNSLVSFAPDNVTELLAVSMPQIYKNNTKFASTQKTAPTVPAPAAKQKVSITNMKKCKEQGGGAPAASGVPPAGPSNAAASSSTSNTTAPNAPNGGPHIPTQWDDNAPVDGRAPCALNATYSVKSLPDHRGPVFQHVRSVVVQPEVYNMRNELVHPRDLAYYLKPGVLLLMEGKFAVWHIPGGNSLVQFLADAVRVIADSDEPPQLPQASGDDNPPSASRPADKRTAAFLNFGRGGSAKRFKTTSDASPSSMSVKRDDDLGALSNAVDKNMDKEAEDDDESDPPISSSRPLRNRKGKNRAV